MIGRMIVTTGTGVGPAPRTVVLGTTGAMPGLRTGATSDQATQSIQHMTEATLNMAGTATSHHRMGTQTWSLQALQAFSLSHTRSLSQSQAAGMMDERATATRHVIRMQGVKDLWQHQSYPAFCSPAATRGFRPWGQAGRCMQVRA